MSSAAATVWPPAYADAATGDRLFSGRPLPRAGHVLAVTARPGQESADLGRLLYAFRRRGASLALLSLTRGEASPLNSTCERLEVIRPSELQVAAGLLGVSSLMMADYADGGLSRYPAAELTERVRRAIRGHAADLLLVIDPARNEPSRNESAGTSRPVTMPRWPGRSAPPPSRRASRPWPACRAPPAAAGTSTWARTPRPRAPSSEPPWPRTPARPWAGPRRNAGWTGRTTASRCAGWCRRAGCPVSPEPPAHQQVVQVRRRDVRIVASGPPRPSSAASPRASRRRTRSPRGPRIRPGPRR